MRGRSRKSPREKDHTRQYAAGELDEDQAQEEQFSDRSKFATQRKIEETAALRDAEGDMQVDLDTLTVGQVMQVYSLYSELLHEGQMYLCVKRKTMMKLSATAIVVGDRVRFRSTGATDESGRPEAIIEQVLPRETVLTRAESFKQKNQHPIVANAQQMLIVASIVEPKVKWGLIDRMLVAAQSGKLEPIICLNKIDLASPAHQAAAQRDSTELVEVSATVDELEHAFESAQSALGHYRSLGIRTLQTSAPENVGLDALRDTLKDRITVLAGHSGVGKSSLINSIQSQLDLRTGAISGFTMKGRHTTSSARWYPLDFGGAVIDTPGVKHFGLWGVTRENLLDFFPDVASETAPRWRAESYQRILASLPNGEM